MKKIIMIFTAFCVILGCLTGCYGTKSSNGKSSSEQLSAVADENKIEASNRVDSSDEANAQSTAIENSETTTLENTNITNNNDNISEFNGTAYIDVYDNFVTIDDKLFTEGCAHLNSRSKSELYLDYVLTYQNTLYLDNNGEFVQFDMDNDVGYCTGSYSIHNNSEINFKYEKCYIYGDKIYDFRQLLIEETVFENDYKYDLNDGHVEAYLHDLSNANEYKYMSHVGIADCCNGFDDVLPPPAHLDNYDNKNNWSFVLSHGDDAVKPKIKDNYIITEQNGYYFSEVVNSNEFTLQYSNLELLSNPETNYSFHSGQEREDLILDNLSIKFTKDKTWSITNNSNYSYYGNITGNWELIDKHILAIICNDCSESEAINFLYLDFENNEIYIPLFVECPSMLPLIDEFNELKD